MWGKRRKPGTRLSRQLALGLLQDAMAQVEQQQEAEAEPGRYLGAPYQEAPSQEAPYQEAPYQETGPAGPPDQAGLRPADVPVDNSAGPAAAEDSAPPQRELPARRTTDRTRRGSFG